MATPAEKKALLFLGALIMLGGAVRLWRADGKNRRTNKSIASAVNHQSGSRTSKPPALQTTGYSNSQPKGAPNKTTRKSTSRSAKPNPDNLTDPVDLDVISLSDFVATGIVKPGIARMIIANRDSFGPFGSILELHRIPYLRKTTITTLAPYVTFSRVPRPLNTVVHPLASTEALPAKASRTKRRSP